MVKQRFGFIVLTLLISLSLFIAGPVHSDPPDKILDTTLVMYDSDYSSVTTTTNDLDGKQVVVISQVNSDILPAWTIRQQVANTEAIEAEVITSLLAAYRLEEPGWYRISILECS